MNLNNLKIELIKFLDDNNIIIGKVIIDENDFYLVEIKSKIDKSENSISVQLENSERFGLSAALYAFEEYYFEGDNVLNQLKRKIKEEITNLKYFNIYGNNGRLLMSNVFIEEKWDKRKIIQILENNFIFDKNDKPEMIVVSDFNGKVSFQIDLKEEKELKMQNRE